VSARAAFDNTTAAQPALETRYRVPVAYMHGGVQRYLDHGIPPGSFLKALFSNDLKEAFHKADDQNIALMLEWVRFMFNDMPSNSQGSPEAVEAWIAHGGLSGEEA